MATLGRQLAAPCLPGGAGTALQGLVDGLALGQRLELAIESADPALLGMPFEALRLPDGRLPATQPGVVMGRSPAGLAAPAQPPLAGATWSSPCCRWAPCPAPRPTPTCRRPGACCQPWWPRAASTHPIRAWWTICAA